MKANSPKGKCVKTVFAAALLIGASTLIFQGFTQAAAAAEYNKTNTVPTSYVNSADVSSKTVPPEGYQKAGYTVKPSGLPYYADKTPAEKDMTQEAAAELAAQYLWQVYGADLEGQTIEMGYDTAADSTPRPIWVADVEMKGQGYRDGYRVDSYYVRTDAVTGELLDIGMSRTLKEKVKAGPDWSLDKNHPAGYEEAAKKLAEKYHIVHSGIESIHCTGQGASFPKDTAVGTYGDPDISFEVHGENGEAALLTISRYDGVLEGVAYDGEYKYDLLRQKELEKEAQTEAEAEKKAAAVSGNQAPSLQATSGS